MPVPNGLAGTIVQWLIMLAVILIPASIPITVAWMRRIKRRALVTVLAVLFSWTIIGAILLTIVAALAERETPVQA